MIDTIPASAIRAAGGYDAWHRREAAKKAMVKPGQAKAKKALQAAREGMKGPLHPAILELFEQDWRITAGTRTEPPNPAEVDHWWRLQGEMADGVAEWIGFEPVKLALAHECTYTPDFGIVSMVGGIILDEVKGAHKWEDSWIKLKMAATCFPDITFRFWQVVKGRWTCKVIPALRRGEGE